jgi:hypothetical protein
VNIQIHTQCLVCDAERVLEYQVSAGKTPALCPHCAAVYLLDGAGASTEEMYKMAMKLAQSGYKLRPSFEVLLGERDWREIEAHEARLKAGIKSLEMETLRTQFGGDLDDLLEPRE